MMDLILCWCVVERFGKVNYRVQTFNDWLKWCHCMLWTFLRLVT